ncbi:MAG TPA: nickel-dependent hydrogenase large subunit [Syntrophomonadaceae bacterium]|nr:nickel-dependent hydrogenase large subunit [Syntrophomonadaceae bacterium]
MAKIVVDPVTRIEGHLKLEVEVEGGVVVDAYTGGTLWRGLELIMQGRDPRDAEQIMQRICGVCPTAHATAGIMALDDAFGIEPPPAGRIIRNLILGTNYLQSHILHFFHLAALDYVKGPDIAPFKPRYEADYRLPADINAQAVDIYLEALTIRRKAQEMLAIWGGKMPHVQAIVPGGVSETPDTSKIYQYLTSLEEISDFIDKKYVPTVVAVAGVYKDWYDIGRGCQNMLAYGGFPLEEGKDFVAKKKFFNSGVYIQGQYGALNPKVIAEEVQYSWYKDDTGGKTPDIAVISPDVKKKDAYSFLKAPRYNGAVMEVGPLARQWINKTKEVTDLKDQAFSVMGRHFARAIETQQMAKACKDWAMELTKYVGQPVCTPHTLPKTEVVGMGLAEASRGALGHWHRISSGGRTKVYNAVVPTTWNASPRTGSGAATVRGPMEQAIIGTKVADPNNPVELVRIVRAYDPCFGCAIHLMTPDKKTIAQFAIN